MRQEAALHTGLLFSSIVGSLKPSLLGGLDRPLIVEVRETIVACFWQI